MKDNIFKILDERKIFKLILGLGNSSEESIESCVEIYAKSGCDMIDVNASSKAIEAVFNGIQKAGRKRDDVLIGISIGVSGDTHIAKAEINNSKCKKCFSCIKRCPQEAILVNNTGYPYVITEKCIGCKKCKCKAINYLEKENDFDEAILLAKKYNLDCIELHFSSKKPPYDKIEYLVKNANVPLSFCLDRKYYSNEKIKKIVRKITKWLGSSRFIIQADGVPMSGGEDTFKSTLQAVAMAHVVQDFGGYIILSGGTNSKSSQLAKMCDVRYNGIGVGSYARNIIKDKTYSEAIDIAKNLVLKCKE